MASTQDDTNCSGKTYKHQPLDVKRHQIRLLKLRNPDEHTMDYCLVTFDFKNAPPYVALSYAWGEEHPTGFVSIDGKKLEIRINLLNFLKTYKTDDYLWVDQICIDQANPEERNHQVGIMSKIYTRCDFVLVWLRDEPTYTPSTRQAALDFNNGVESYSDHWDREDGSNADKKNLDCPTLILLHNSYFERLWIVQELLLPERIRILVEGDVWVSWESLYMKYSKLEDEVKEMLPSTSWMMKSRFYQFTFGSYIDLTMLSTITFTSGKFCDKKCKDPRDKVYGLMALVSPSNRIEIDYTKSFHQVFLDAFVSMIREYWDMRYVAPKEAEYEIDETNSISKESRDAPWRLAQAMGFTDVETSGLRSFVECIWERIRLFEVTARSSGVEVDIGTPWITSVGFERGTHQLSDDKRLMATCDRWWYEFEGKRYYHDCKEWSGQAKHQEYTTA